MKLLDNMRKYEMNPASIMEDTEQARFRPQTDGRTGGQTDGQGEAAFNFVEARGTIKQQMAHGSMTVVASFAVCGLVRSV